MLYATTTPADKRVALRDGLASGRLLRLPGAFNPLSARLIEAKGFDGVYISGAVLVRRPRAAGHRADDGHRGHAARRADRADDRPARDRRRGHRASASP